MWNPETAVSREYRVESGTPLPGLARTAALVAAVLCGGEVTKAHGEDIGRFPLLQWNVMRDQPERQATLIEHEEFAQTLIDVRNQVDEQAAKEVERLALQVDIRNLPNLESGITPIQRITEIVALLETEKDPLRQAQLVLYLRDLRHEMDLRGENLFEHEVVKLHLFRLYETSNHPLVTLHALRGLFEWFGQPMDCDYQGIRNAFRQLAGMNCDGSHDVVDPMYVKRNQGHLEQLLDFYTEIDAPFEHRTFTHLMLLVLENDDLGPAAANAIAKCGKDHEVYRIGSAYKQRLTEDAFQDAQLAVATDGKYRSGTTRSARNSERMRLAYIRAIANAQSDTFVPVWLTYAMQQDPSAAIRLDAATGYLRRIDTDPKPNPANAHRILFALSREEQEPDVCMSAVEQLKRVACCETSFLEPAREMLKNPSAVQRTLGAQILAAIGPTAAPAIEDLIRQMRGDTHAHPRIEARTALERIATGDAALQQQLLLEFEEHHKWRESYEDKRDPSRVRKRNARKALREMLLNSSLVPRI